MTIVESESATHHKKLADLQKLFVSHTRPSTQPILVAAAAQAQVTTLKATTRLISQT